MRFSVKNATRVWGKGNKQAKSSRYKDLEIEDDFTFIVKYRISVNIALAVQETSALSQTPLSSSNGVKANNAAIGNTRVPKNAASIERTGLSSAVK